MKKETRRVDVGMIELGGQVMVSDPCYNNGVWCQGVVENVLPGKYQCWYIESDEGNWGKRVAKLYAVHEDFPGAECDEETEFEVGVDSGQAGIYDKAYFDKTRRNEEWYEKVCHLTYQDVDDEGRRIRGGTLDGKCAVSSSGYGDGGYACFTSTNSDGEVVGIMIDYGL